MLNFSKIKQDKDDQIQMSGGVDTEEYRAERKQLHEKMKSIRDLNISEAERSQIINDQLRQNGRGIREEPDSDETAQEIVIQLPEPSQLKALAHTDQKSRIPMSPNKELGSKSQAHLQLDKGQQPELGPEIANLRASMNLRESLMSGLSRGSRVNYQLSDSDDDEDEEKNAAKSALRASR